MGVVARANRHDAINLQSRTAADVLVRAGRIISRISASGIKNDQTARAALTQVNSVARELQLAVKRQVHIDDDLKVVIGDIRVAVVDAVAVAGQAGDGQNEYGDNPFHSGYLYKNMRFKSTAKGLTNYSVSNKNIYYLCVKGNPSRGDFFYFINVTKRAPDALIALKIQEQTL